MSLVLIIAGWGLAVIAASTLVWHRRREQAARFAWARENGLELYKGRPRELLHRLHDLTLLQLGHSREIEAAFSLPNGGYAFYYRCQTGFDHDRFLHTWIVAALETRHGAGRAVITSQDWIRTAAQSTSHRLLAKGEPGSAESYFVIVDDADEWRPRLGGDVGRWFRNQPPARTWEFLSGWIVGYEPGAAEGRPLLNLAASANELALLVADPRPAGD